MKARSTSQSSCGLGSLGQRREMLSTKQLASRELIDWPQVWINASRNSVWPSRCQRLSWWFGRKGNGAGKTNSLMGKVIAFRGRRTETLPVKAVFLTRYIKSYIFIFINIQKFHVVIAPDSEACVPRTASRTEFECLAANFQSLKGPKREPLWKLVICWWDWELKFGAWVGNKGTYHLFCFSVYSICVCNRVYIYI